MRRKGYVWNIAVALFLMAAELFEVLFLVPAGIWASQNRGLTCSKPCARIAGYPSSEFVGFIFY